MDYYSPDQRLVVAGASFDSTFTGASGEQPIIMMFRGEEGMVFEWGRSVQNGGHSVRDVVMSADSSVIVAHVMPVGKFIVMRSVDGKVMSFLDYKHNNDQSFATYQGLIADSSSTAYAFINFLDSSNTRRGYLLMSFQYYPDTSIPKNVLKSANPMGLYDRALGITFAENQQNLFLLHLQNATYTVTKVETDPLTVL
ncbi:hypothetical protein FGO68_gene9931 [Halteria grandinella]|uniref:Uncharacterized protein n=1 Tax=Halteria grandinella TaxID=5974 RepID=A0A8J8P6R2_HALGN|nr:hypothetical protein FGO68_gene9931 [Halteria grandinella]